MAQSMPDRVTDLLDPAVAAAGLVLEGVSITPAGKRRVVRVVVDLTDDATGNVDLDHVAAVAHAVSEVLESSDVLGGNPYVLEVTSPGVDRPLTTRRHWSRARGRLVTVAPDGEEAVTGRVVDVTDSGVALTLEDGPRVLAWDGLGRGAVQVEFNRQDSGDEGPDDEGPDDEGPDDEGPDDEGPDDEPTGYRQTEEA